MIDKILIPNEHFKTVLNENLKILFSGVFGSGKTTFINDFFKEYDEYVSIHIYPVNYSVATNEDIFELIKYDILFQLIGVIDKEDFFKLEIPYQLTLYTYLSDFSNIQNKLDFFSSFLSFMGKYGTASLKVYQQIKHLKDNYIKFHKQFQEDDFDKVNSFLENVLSQKGHIYEEDFFTELIRNLINHLKDSENKEIVLVVDDLDRLDPEHIFRLLNIFSVHIDFLGKENVNKFNFDRIIFVCDYPNLEKIFTHKYGLDTDFKGYINKFYNSIYWFDSSSLIKDLLWNYLNKIKTNVDYNIFKENYRFNNQLSFVLKQFLDLDLISFRDLINYNKIYKINSSYEKRMKHLQGTTSILKRHNLDSELTISFLIDFFSNDLELIKAINVAKRKNIPSHLVKEPEEYLDLIGELVLLINHDKVSDNGINLLNDLTLEYNDYLFYYNHSLVNRTDYKISVECKEVAHNKVNINPSKLNYFYFLEGAVKVYIDITK